MRHKKEIVVLLALAVVATVANKNTSLTTNTGCCGPLVLTPAKLNVTEFIACNHDCIDEVYIVGLSCSVHKPTNQKSWPTVHVKMDEIKTVNGRFVLSVLAQCDFNFLNLEEIKGSVATVEFIDESKSDFLSGIKVIHTEDEACRSTSSIREVTGHAAVAMPKFEAAVKAGINACTPKGVSGGIPAGSGPGSSSQNNYGNNTDSVQAAGLLESPSGLGLLIGFGISLLINLVLFFPGVAFFYHLIACKSAGKPVMKTYNLALTRWCKINAQKSLNETIESFEKEQEKPLDEADKFEPDPKKPLDVPCLKDSRVVTTEDKFVNANYVDLPDHSHRFIALQVPKMANVENFWLMVIQENVEVIIMVCNLVEQNDLKMNTCKDVTMCSEYFPTSIGASLTYGSDENQDNNIKVTCSEFKTFPFVCKTSVSIEVNVLTVKAKKKTHTVTHYHWKNWLHETTPANDEAMLNLLDAIQNIKSPVVVHCSNGGRSGVVIMADYIYSQIRLNHAIQDPITILATIRSMRWKMIDTADQFLFVLHLFINYCEKKYQVDKETKQIFNKFNAEYEERMAGAPQRAAELLKQRTDALKKKREQKKIALTE